MFPLFLALLPTSSAGKGLSVPSLTDTDGDGIMDTDDLCAWEDDAVDLDSDGIADCAQTFVSDFGMSSTSAFNFWTESEPSGTDVSWWSDDANGYGPSGAMWVQTSTAQVSPGVGSVCILVNPSTPHVFYSQVKLFNAAGEGQGDWQVFGYSSTDCSPSAGTGVEASGSISIDTADTTGWRTWGDHFVTGSSTQAVRINFQVWTENHPAPASSFLYLDNFNLHDRDGEEENPGEPGDS